MMMPQMPSHVLNNNNANSTLPSLSSANFGANSNQVTFGPNIGGQVPSYPSWWYPGVVFPQNTWNNDVGPRFHVGHQPNSEVNLNIPNSVQVPVANSSNRGAQEMHPTNGLLSPFVSLRYRRPPDEIGTPLSANTKTRNPSNNQPVSRLANNAHGGLNDSLVFPTPEDVAPAKKKRNLPKLEFPVFTGESDALTAEDWIEKVNIIAKVMEITTEDLYTLIPLYLNKAAKSYNVAMSDSEVGKISATL